MVGIGVLSAFTLWTLWDQAGWWWLPVGCMALLLVLRWNRFWGVIMPALWHAVVGLFRGGRNGKRRMVVDDWAE